MEDLISVIVPVYNVDKYLRKCVDSILGQTYRNIEIILIDDGSKDQSGKICDEYKKIDDRVIVIHQKNSGVSSARNKGIKLSKGKWITFVDSDDWIEKDFCKIMLKNLKQNAQADCAICTYNRIVKGKAETNSFSNGKKILDSKEYLINILNPQTGYGFCHMKLIKKECVQGIYFNEKMTVVEDALFNIELSNNVRNIIYVEQKLYNYRLNMKSVVKRYDENYATKYLTAMKLCKKYIYKNYEDNENVVQNYYNFVAYHVLLVAVNYCYNPQNKKKKNTLKKICNYQEFKEGIEKSNYNNISLSRKIALFTLKHKLYVLTSLICIIRQMQIKEG